MAAGNELRPLLLLSSSLTWVGNAALAPAASAATSWLATSAPPRGLFGSKSDARTKYRPIENGVATATGPILRTVLGVETALPVSVLVGALTEAMIRSGRPSRIVSVAVFAALRSAFTGLLSTIDSAR